MFTLKGNMENIVIDVSPEKYFNIGKKKKVSVQICYILSVSVQMFLLGIYKHQQNMRIFAYGWFLVVLHSVYTPIPILRESLLYE